jgi:hypothetical protein
MTYKVLKKLYCPILGRRVEKGEEIEIVEDNLEAYRQYVEVKEEEVKKAPTIEEAMSAPPMEFMDRKKKK